MKKYVLNLVYLPSIKDETKHVSKSFLSYTEAMETVKEWLQKEEVIYWDINEVEV